MDEITAEELAEETMVIVGRATQGESMVITDGGRPIAFLLPSPAEQVPATTAPGEGRA